MIADKLLADQNFIFKDGVFHQRGFLKNDFEVTYIDIRKKEGRILTNAEVLKLPDVEKAHQHFKEWRIRKRSSERLFKYLNHNKGHKSILEIGCGNGWLSHRLSMINNVDVIGLDINMTELMQAADVFRHLSNLRFIKGDVFTIDLPIKIDYIVLASSIQYFPDIVTLCNTLLEKISRQGEIHIIDSPFYHEDDVRSAKERSKRYFESQHSKMPEHYYHHCWDALQNFNFKILHNPASMVSRLKNLIQIGSPFPWIKINHA